MRAVPTDREQLMADDRESNPPVPGPQGRTELLLYQSEDGQARIEVRLVG